ncbi:MAG: hypothetical protein ACUZ8I_10295 [Candidatus Scalindua sp.]
MKVHKTKERGGSYGIRQIIYGGYVVMSTHRVEHWIKEYSRIKVSYLWKPVTCLKCLAMRK